MSKIDWQEKSIISYLIRNPRASDNEISRKTKIPLKSVNRKRKKLESQGLIYYFTYLDNSPAGTGCFGSRKLYTVRLKRGITRNQIAQKIAETKQQSSILKAHS